jgi:hypothetical protein
MSLRSIPPKKLEAKLGLGFSPLRRLAVLAGAVVLLLVGWLWFGRQAAQQAALAPVLAARPAAAPKRAVAPGKPVEQTVTVASGQSVRLIRRPRLGLPTPPYGPAYRELEPLARAGDKVAQYKLGLLLYECRDVPTDTASLEQEIESTYETRRRGGWDVDDPASEEQSLRRRYGECEGVPPAARGQYRDWLKQAADAGLMEAQLDLPRKLPPGNYCQFLSECPPDQRAKQEALDQEAVDYLGRARDAGSVMALWTFGAWYTDGDVLPQDYVEAYADYSALQQVLAAAGEDQRFDAILADLRSHLRPADLEQAQSRTQQILASPNCCVLTP